MKEGTGRVVRYELVPLEEMGGRPRVDALCNMSGIFRDSFANVVGLLDDLFQRAADADEPPELNFVRKHALEMRAEGLDNAGARLFSNPPGDYGSMVNERVGTSEWEDGRELGDTWASRNAFSYGKGNERGTARPEVLQALLRSTERVVQEVDSVEYGLTDIQEYYANTGALVAAANAAKEEAAIGDGSGPPTTFKPVACSIVETFGEDVTPRDLDETLRLEYRTKLLNPRWAEAMADQDPGRVRDLATHDGARRLGRDERIRGGLGVRRCARTIRRGRGDAREAPKEQPAGVQKRPSKDARGGWTRHVERGRRDPRAAQGALLGDGRRARGRSNATVTQTRVARD